MHDGLSYYVVRAFYQMVGPSVPTYRHIYHVASARFVVVSRCCPQRMGHCWRRLRLLLRLLSLRAVNLRHVAVAKETGVDGPRQSGISELAQKLQPGFVDRHVDFRFRHLPAAVYNVARADEGEQEPFP